MFGSFRKVECTFARSILVCGLFDWRVEEIKMVRFSLLAQDVVYLVRNEGIKTSKRLELGMVMYSIRENRKEN